MGGLGIMEYEEIGLRAKHKLDTKLRIEKAASELFGKYGFQATTIEMIASAVDISPRTIFRYFESKEDLLLAKVIASLDEIIKVLQNQPPEESCLEAFKRSMLDVLTKENTGLATVVNSAMREIGTERTTARLITSLHHWENDVANIFCERIKIPDNLTSFSETEIKQGFSAEEYNSYITKINNTKLLAAIGTSIFRTIFTYDENHLSDKIYSNWLEAQIKSSFYFLESGCEI